MSLWILRARLSRPEHLAPGPTALCGGGIDEWRLEFCGALAPRSPFVVTNDTLAVLPANTKTISAGELEIGDNDNGKFFKFSKIEF